MPPKAEPTDFPIYSFCTAKDFEDFLEREHITLPGFYLKLAKKGSGIPSVSKEEAIDVVLCFGWIDGRAGGLDQDTWLVRFTPRRKKSIWSEKNVNSVSRLSNEGRMRPAGLRAVEAAKADGRWDRAYAGPASITVPDDFAGALAQQPDAQDFFDTLNRSSRYSVLWRIQTASPTARSGRIKAMVNMLANGSVPGVAGHTKDKAKVSSVSKALNKADSTRRSREKITLARSGQDSPDEATRPHPAVRPRREGLRRRK